MSWWDYVQQHKGDADQAQIASWAGVTPPTVSRWKSGKIQPAPTAAANFARSCRRPVLEALVAAGFLSEDEAKARPARRPDYSQLTNDELLELVRARMSEGGEHGGNTAATKDPGSGPGKVSPLTKRDEMQQIQKRAARSTD